MRLGYAICEHNLTSLPYAWMWGYETAVGFQYEPDRPFRECAYKRDLR